MQDFKIKTEVFEGPLDLLLNLIEKRKLHISDIALAKVTDDFIKYVQEIPSYSISDRAQFILIASTLLLIKSRSLLPSLSLTDEEQENIEDLETRLKLYQKIKELGLHIKERYGKEMIYFPEYHPKMISVFSPHECITLENIVSSLKDAIKRLPIKEQPPKATVRKVMSLEEMIDKLTDRIRGALKISFHEFSGGRKAVSKEEKVEAIVSFLAMLELVKQGVIDAMQEVKHGDISMETEEKLGIPRY
jgi:segregation and condensation protein A